MPRTEKPIYFERYQPSHRSLKGLLLTQPNHFNAVFKRLSGHEALKQGDPVAANRVVLKWSADALKVEMATLRFFSRDRLILRCMEHYQQPAKWLQGGPEFKTGEIPRFFLAVENSGVMAVTDAENDRRTEELFDRFLQTRGVVSLMVAPVRVLGDHVGIVSFKHTEEKREWTDAEKAFAGEVGQLAAQVLVNSKRMRVEEKLRRYRGRLETLVEGRTEALAKANADLKREIALRERSETAFKESEERYRKLYESAPFGIFHSEIEPEGGRAIDANPAMARMLGYGSPDELMTVLNQTSIVEAVYAEPAEKRKIVIEEVLKSKGWIAYEQRYRRKDGGTLIARQRVRAVRDQEGKPLFLEGFVEDITQKHLAENEAKELQKQLMASQKREAIGLLAGGIAHDFNNLLSPIMGFAELALCELPANNKLRKHIDHILTAAGRARDLARQILTFSHQGKQERRPVLLQSLVEEAVQLLRHSLPSNIQIRTDTEVYCDPVLADPTQIQQVLVNLGTNAYHAMKDDGGGALELRIRPVELASEDVPGFPEAAPGPYAELAVSDTGSGIEQEMIEKIFDPYFTTKGVGEGTGLGLSLVHGIVTNHGGAIAVESRPGEGTTFRIFLPRLISDQHEVWESVEETVCLGERQHLLVVDDEKPVLEMMADMLTFCNYDVTTVAESAKALEAVRAKPDGFDAVVTDLTMPGMSGVQLAREIAVFSPSLPVILCTGFSEALSEEQITAAGIRKLLLKPVGMQAISSTLSEVLGCSGEGAGEDN